MNVAEDFHLTEFRTSTNWSKERKALAFSYLMECAKGKPIQELIDDEVFADRCFRKIVHWSDDVIINNGRQYYLTTLAEQCNYIAARHMLISNLSKLVLQTQINDSNSYVMDLVYSRYYRDAKNYADERGRLLEFEFALMDYIQRNS